MSHKQKIKLPRKAAACLLLLTAVSSAVAQNRSGWQINLLREFRPIGGVGNNLKHPALNVAPGDPEIALAPLNFAPGTKNGLIQAPNARTISNVISGGTGANGENGETTDNVASAWLYVFGQFLDHDLGLESTPLTTPAINIPIPAGDPVFAPGTSIAMTRAVRSPVTNTIINTVAGYLDLSQLYGCDTATAASLRNPDGTLASSYNGLYLPIVNQQFVTGDPRVMENPELSAVTILFMREHNFWVSTLKSRHPEWTGDQLYNMAKAITTAEYQNIVYKEYLPVLVGPNALGAYDGYHPNVDAQVSQEFSTAVFRLHTQISDTQAGIDNQGNEVFSQPLAEAFFNTAQMDINNGINPLLRGLGTDYAQGTDVYVVSALRNLLFAGLVGGGIDEMDLIAIDIQREKDVGLGSLNQTRRAIGMRPWKNWADLTPDVSLQKNLQTVYGTIDKLDLFTGGLAEPHVRGAVVGPTFRAIIADQFEALRAGDRFFWLNQGFDRTTAAVIANTSLADLLKRNAATPNPPPNLFIATPLPGPVRPHPHGPAVVDTHGHRRPVFVNDGN